MQVALFDPELVDTAVDETTQVSRIPGIDAPCVCDRDSCAWPWCTRTRGPELQQARPL